MAKDKMVEVSPEDGGVASIDAEEIDSGPAFPGHGEPLSDVPAPQRVGPSAAQHAWLQNNPQYARASHFFGRMVERGTLHEDGSFVSETKTPAMDGPTCFTVGIPLRR
jgi:hypothetical protein